MLTQYLKNNIRKPLLNSGTKLQICDMAGTFINEQGIIYESLYKCLKNNNMIQNVLSKLNNKRNIMYISNCYMIGSVSLSCVGSYYFLNDNINNYNDTEDMTYKKMYRLYNDT